MIATNERLIRAMHINDVTALDTNRKGSYVTYFPRSDLQVANVDHTREMIQFLMSLGFRSTDEEDTGTYKGAETKRYELTRGPEQAIVTEYVKFSDDEYIEWCHVKAKAAGAVAIEIRKFVNEYNTKLEMRIG